MIFEALAHGDVATAAFLSIHNMAAWMIDRFGSDDLRRRYLPRLTTMELIASYCLTEPGAGSDAAALAHHARERDGDHYVLNGAKAFISGAGTSDVYVVMARTGGDGAERRLDLRGREGHARPVLRRPGAARWAGTPSPPPWCIFDNVPRAGRQPRRRRGRGLPHRHGRPRRRAAQHRRLLAGRRASWPWTRPRPTSTTRKQFGRPLADFQALQFKLADMATELEAARLMVRRAAAALDAGDAGGHQALRHGQALRHRRRLRGRQPGPAAARRLRLPEGLSRWSGSSATCASTRSWRGPTRSCA